jgi:hypothetical protein
MNQVHRAKKYLKSGFAKRLSFAGSYNIFGASKIIRIRLINTHFFNRQTKGSFIIVTGSEVAREVISDINAAKMQEA